MDVIDIIIIIELVAGLVILTAFIYHVIDRYILFRRQRKELELLFAAMLRGEYQRQRGGLPELVARGVGDSILPSHRRSKFEDE